MPNRTISHDSRALGESLLCSYPVLRAAALDIVLRAIKAHGGQVGAICEALGIGSSTYTSWRERVPEIAAAHDALRPESTPGPKPRKRRKSRG